MSIGSFGRGGALVPGGGRGLDALKQEVQRRADRGIPPLSGVAPGDVQTALSRVASLEREEWAIAFSGVGDAYSDDYLNNGVALFAIDLPGTGESPHAVAGLDSDRIFSAALDALAKRPETKA